uniref:Uncharacterized protein LOC108949341 n=1 Tax=Phallusia mammillata TaxID=59560 RepID=A0A6F9DJP4_9ASCI|nr:uncharacterized protein LOC108949341 [Phallusia mammillata]
MSSCSWGVCNSNSKYRPEGPRPREDMKGVRFFTIPTLKNQPEKCKLWVDACGRDGFQTTNVTIKSYICSKHFVDGEPTEKNPNPIDARTLSQEELLKFCVPLPPTENELKRTYPTRSKNTSEMISKSSAPRVLKHKFKGCSCLAPGCDERHRNTNNNGVILHSFPQHNEELLEQWLSNCGIDKNDLQPNSKLCSRHFTENCYTKKKRKDKHGKVYRSSILKNVAVPTKFFPSVEKCSKKEDDAPKQEDSDITKKYLNTVKREKTPEPVIKQLKSFVSFNTFYEPKTYLESQIEVAGYTFVTRKKQGSKPESSEAITQTEQNELSTSGVQTEPLDLSSVQTQTQDKLFWNAGSLEEMKKARLINIS